MAVIDYSLISQTMRADSRAIRTASRNTTSDVAKIGQREITKEAIGNMDFRGNEYRALGLKVKKATYRNMTAEVYTNRKWLAYHKEQGTRSGGFSFKGKSYNGVLVPVAKEAFTKAKRSKLKAKYFRGAYIAGNYMFYRRKSSKRKKHKSILIAVIKQTVKYKDDIKGDKVFIKVIDKHATKIFKQQLSLYINKR